MCLKPSDKILWILFSIAIIISFHSNQNNNKTLWIAYAEDLSISTANTPLPNSVPKRYILNLRKLRSYVDLFNQYDEEYYINLIPNTQAYSFLSDNIPLIDIPDSSIESTYYFRWWTYRKHIKQVPITGIDYVITEFMATVPWSGPQNTINCAAGHHFREGRWLHDTKYLKSYAKFWFQEPNGGNPRAYSFWPANAIWAFYRVSGSYDLLEELFERFLWNFRVMLRTNYDKKIGLYFNTDNRDGMELSAGSLEGERAYRPTLNSYMAAEAKIISKLAKFLRKSNETYHTYLNRAIATTIHLDKYLWDMNQSFYKALPVKKKNKQQIISDTQNHIELNSLVSVRELHGYTPWYFNLPDRSLHLEAWKQIIDPKGFYASHGLTTAEQRHKNFAVEYSKSHECRWNGPSWPFATSITLTGMANILQDYKRDLGIHREYLCNEVFYEQLQIYAKSHRRTIEPGESLHGIIDSIPWIDENIHPYTGDWISRTLLKTWKNGTWSDKKGGKERGKDYNHSTFVDLVLSGLIGFYPRSNSSFELRPLIPKDKNDDRKRIWKYFCIDQLHYRGHYITIIYDELGDRYHLGMGLKVLVDGVIVSQSHQLPDRVIIRFS